MATKQKQKTQVQLRLSDKQLRKLQQTAAELAASKQRHSDAARAAFRHAAVVEQQQQLFDQLAQTMVASLGVDPVAEDYDVDITTGAVRLRPR